MYPETTESLWPRRALLKSAGLSMLAASGLPFFHPYVPQAWAAGERTRFVATWNSPDIMDPHVKYDVGAAAFNLNIYDNLLRYQGNPPGHEYNLDKAREHLARAKVKITRPIEVHVQAPLEPTVQAALLFQSDLAKLGIELKIVKSMFPSIVASTKTVESTPDMWIHWVSTYFVDPENWIGEMYDSANGGTWKASSWYKNSQVDGLLVKARSIIAQEERARLYEEACRLIVEDAPDIWVYNTIEYVPLAKMVQGFRFSLVGSGQEFWPVSFDPRA